MATLEELRRRAAEAERAAEEQERQELEKRIEAAESRTRNGQYGMPLAPMNPDAYGPVGPAADLARYRDMIHADTLTEQVSAASNEMRRALKLMIEDAVKRHSANVQSGRGDLGHGPASFYER